MALWTLSRERQRMQMALLLLMVSGVIRPASLEPSPIGSNGAMEPSRQVADTAA